MGRRLGWLTICALILMTGIIYAQEPQGVYYETPIVRLKDVARIQGARDNQIYGLGLVVGLEGTGDGMGARANVQMIANMLEGFGVTVSPDDLRMRNIAAVMVTADISNAVRTGDRIDVTVSSIGDARSLQGGFLLQTPLQAANGQVYAVAQGPLSIGGFVVRGGSSRAQTNHTTVGMVPNGAIVEREIGTQYEEDGFVAVVLNEPDFTTAARLVDVVNQVFGQNSAWAADQATVQIEIPPRYRNNLVGFIAELEELPLRPDVNARVVINERTGTVVMGASVRISQVAVSHGSLSVRVESTPQVSQPEAFSDGETVMAFDTMITAEEQMGQFTVLDGGSNVQDLVDSLNAIGASPRDIIAILQAVKAAGALFGELIII